MVCWLCWCCVGDVSCVRPTLAGDTVRYRDGQHWRLHQPRVGRSQPTLWVLQFYTLTFTLSVSHWYWYCPAQYIVFQVETFKVTLCRCRKHCIDCWQGRTLIQSVLSTSASGTSEFIIVIFTNKYISSKMIYDENISKLYSEPNLCPMCVCEANVWWGGGWLTVYSVSGVLWAVSVQYSDGWVFTPTIISLSLLPESIARTLGIRRREWGIIKYKHSHCHLNIIAGNVHKVIPTRTTTIPAN